MKIIKLIFRIIISLVLIVPLTPLLWTVVTVFGLFLIIPISGFFKWIGELLKHPINKEELDDSKAMMSTLPVFFIYPFVVFYHFIVKGEFKIENF